MECTYPNNFVHTYTIMTHKWCNYNLFNYRQNIRSHAEMTSGYGWDKISDIRDTILEFEITSGNITFPLPLPLPSTPTEIHYYTIMWPCIETLSVINTWYLKLVRHNYTFYENIKYVFCPNCTRNWGKISFILYLTDNLWANVILSGIGGHTLFVFTYQKCILRLYAYGIVRSVRWVDSDINAEKIHPARRTMPCALYPTVWVHTSISICLRLSNMAGPGGCGNFSVYV